MLRQRAAPVLVWDFDGTLGYRDGGAWTATLLEVVQRCAPGSSVTLEELRPTMQTGFPWHQPELPHPDLVTSEAWWAALTPTLERAFLAAGFSGPRAQAMAAQVRPTYLDYPRWRLFDDAMPTLERLSVGGWTHILLSNHVPELPEILDYLGVSACFARIFNSGQTGYEKPHPRAFEMIIESLGSNHPACMIGDSYTADICGAARFSIPGILVRRTHPEARYVAGSLLDVPCLIEALTHATETQA